MTLKTLLCAVAAQAIAASAYAETIAIMNGEVHTITNGVIEGGDVIIEDGEILRVGADLEAPEGATVVDAEGKVVTPGLFAPFSAIGLKELNLDAEANDSRSDDGFVLGASLNALDAFDPTSTLIPINRTGGVTRALASPEIGETLFVGRGAVVDFTGAFGSVTKPAAAQTVYLGYSGASLAGDTRMGSWALVRETLDAATAYAEDPQYYVRYMRDPRFPVSDLKALGPVLAGDAPLLIHVFGASEILTAIALKDAYDLDIAVIGGSEAWMVAEQLAEADIPVILDPLFNLPSTFEDLGATLKNAALLNEAGVKVAFYNPPNETHNLRLLTQQAGNAVAEGLPYEAALEALTLTPATLFGLEGVLGSIEAGKIADIVVWSADPLEVTSAAEAVFIAGVAQDLTNRQTMLRDRYSDLTPGDYPSAYRGDE